MLSQIWQLLVLQEHNARLVRLYRIPFGRRTMQAGYSWERVGVEKRGFVLLDLEILREQWRELIRWGSPGLSVCYLWDFLFIFPFGRKMTSAGSQLSCRNSSINDCSLLKKGKKSLKSINGAILLHKSRFPEAFFVPVFVLLLTLKHVLALSHLHVNWQQCAQTCQGFDSSTQ